MELGLLWILLVPGLPYLIYQLQDFSFLFGLAVVVLLWSAYVAVQRVLSQYTLEHLDKRAVFITGCDTGFGHLLAIKCAKHGMNVFAGCLTEKGAETLRKATIGLAGYVDAMIVDVASDESVARAKAYLETATVKYGGLHGVVNNAGIAGSTFYDDMLSTKDYQAVFDVNTLGVIRVTQALKSMLKKTAGRVVTITSSCARVGFPGCGPYTAAKHATAGYCEVIRHELRPFGVSVHIIEPGFFKTPLIEEKIVKARLDAMLAGVSEEVKKEYGQKFFDDGRARSTSIFSMIGSPSVHYVVDAYFHALTARFPHLRYQVGADAKFIYIPFSYLPTGLRDAIIILVEKVMNAPYPDQAVQKYAPFRKAFLKATTSNT